jgi:four helix bundle protein
MNTMNNKEFAKNLEERTLSFAIAVIQLSAGISYNEESKVIKNQITKSGSSIGANYREANRSRSKADFKNRIRICESEVSESCYWLEIISKMKCTKEEKVSELQKEAGELLAIFFINLCKTQTLDTL